MVDAFGQDDCRCNHGTITRKTQDILLTHSPGYRTYLHSVVHAAMPHII